MPGVFAIGDVARHDHPVFGPIRVEHYDNAIKMAEHVADAMLGSEELKLLRDYVMERGGSIVFARGKAYAGDQPDLAGLEVREGHGGELDRLPEPDLLRGPGRLGEPGRRPAPAGSGPQVRRAGERGGVREPEAVAHHPAVGAPRGLLGGAGPPTCSCTARAGPSGRGRASSVC